jgi:hypothetical protein
VSYLYINPQYTIHGLDVYTPLSTERLAVAASRSLGLVSFWPQIDTRSLLAGPQVAWSGLVERQLLSDSGEEFPHVLAGLCGGFEEEEASFAGVLLGVCGLDGALVGRLGD